MRKVAIVAALAILLSCLTGVASTAPGPTVSIEMGHQAPMCSMAVLSDKHVVTASEDGRVIVWNLSNLEQILTIESGNEGPVRSKPQIFASQQRGLFAVCGGTQPGLFRIYYPNDRELYNFHRIDQELRLMTVSSDLRKAIVIDPRDNRVMYWDLAKAQAILTLVVPTIAQAVFFPDEAKVFLVNAAGKVTVWDLRDNSARASRISEPTGIRYIAVSSDGDHVITISKEDILALWQVSGRRIRDSRKFVGPEISMAQFSTDGRDIICYDAGGRTYIWNVATGLSPQGHMFHQQEVRALASSPDDSKVVMATDWRLSVMGRQPGEPVLAKAQSAPITALALSTDDVAVWVGKADGALTLWNLASGHRVKDIPAHDWGYRWNKENQTHTDAVTSLAMFPDGQHLLSTSWDETASVWLTNRFCTSEDIRAPHPLVGAALSPDGNRALLVEKSGETQLWNLAEDTVEWTLTPDYQVTCACYSPDGRYFLTAGDDRVIRLWDRGSRNLVATAMAQDTPQSLAFSDYGQIVTAEGRNIVLYQVSQTESGIGYKALNTLVGHSAKINSLVISANGLYVLSSSDDKTVRLWDLQNGTKLREFIGHERSVRSAVISSELDFVVSGGDDGTVRVWDVESGHEVVKLVDLYGNNWVACTPDGYFNTSEAGAHLVRLWMPGKSGRLGDAFYESYHQPDKVGFKSIFKRRFYYAVYTGDLEQARGLLAHGVKLDLAEPEMIQLMKAVISKGATDAIALLLSCGMGVNQVDADGISLLQYAVLVGQDQSVQFLVEHGADIAYQTQDGKYPSDLAFSDTVREYLGDAASMLEAAINGDASEVGRLMHKGIPANVHCGTVSAAAFAVLNGHTDLAEILIANGSSTDCTSDYGVTLLMMAIDDNNMELAKMLVDAGVDLDVQDNNGRTALMYAVDKAEPEMVRILIDAGAAVNQEDNYGDTALASAAYYGDYSITKLLLAAGAHVNHRDNQGWTPLMQASVNGKDLSTVKLLVEYGADTTITNNEGKTVLDLLGVVKE